MRWQRSIRQLLNRWSDQVDPFGHELRELGPYVMPTISLGADYVDQERPVYVGNPFSPVVGLDVSHVLLEAGTLELEVLSVIASVTAPTRIGLKTDQNLWTVFEGNLTRPSAAFRVGGLSPPLSVAHPSSGTRVARGTAAWGSAAGVLVAANSPLELLARPAFLPPGNRLAVALQDANVGVSAAFMWRELS